MNVLQTQFLDISVKVRQREREEAAGKKAQRDTDEVEVSDSITHNVQFDVNCQMISWKCYLLK